MARSKLVDASSHNAVNFNVFPQDVNKVILRTSDGKNYTDPRFSEYYSRAKASGKKVSFYHFYRFDYSPTDNFNRFKLAIGGRIPDFSIAMDFEQVGKGSYWPVREIMTLTQAYQDSIVSFRRPSIIYTSPGWWNERIGLAAAQWQNGYDLWVAQWPNSAIDFNTTWILDSFQPKLPLGFSNWKYWQWTGHGKMLGFGNYIGDPDNYGGDVDKGVFNGTDQDFVSYYSPVKIPDEPGEVMTTLNKAYSATLSNTQASVVLFSEAVPAGKTWELQAATIFTRLPNIRVALSVIPPNTAIDYANLTYVLHETTGANLVSNWSGKINLSSGYKVLAVIANEEPKKTFDVRLNILVAES